MTTKKRVDIVRAKAWRFGLPVEDQVEASFIAARNDGACDILAIIWDDALADRQETAALRFSQQQSRCRLVEILRTRSRTASEQISSFFGLTSSNARADRLARYLTQNTTRTPWRRHDIDAILLLVGKDQAASILPSLDYVFASDIPVYLPKTSLPQNIPANLADKLRTLVEPVHQLDRADYVRESSGKIALALGDDDPDLAAARLMAFGSDAVLLVHELFAPVADFIYFGFVNRDGTGTSDS